MTFAISQISFTPEIKKKIYKGFHHAAIAAVGVNGLEEDPICFEIQQQKEQIGVIVVQAFWGQFHIKYLLISERYRRQGLGKMLLNYAFAFGKKRGYTYAFVETMNFQALEFYQKLGFELNFTRPGYAYHTSLHYLQKFF